METLAADTNYPIIFHSPGLEPWIMGIMKSKPNVLKIVLDIGTGFGFWSYLVRWLNPDSQIIGLDISLNKLKTVKRFGFHNDLLLADACNPPFRDDAFTSVLAIEVLHEFQEMPQLLKKLEAIIEKDGLLIASGPLLFDGHVSDLISLKHKPVAFIGRGLLLLDMSSGKVLPLYNTVLLRALSKIIAVLKVKAGYILSAKIVKTSQVLHMGSDPLLGHVFHGVGLEPWIASIVKISSTDMVLDIGTGMGFWGYLIKTYINPRSFVVGLDVSIDSLKKLKSLRIYNELVCADVRYLPFRDDTFSLAMVIWVVHWILGKGSSELKTILRSIEKLVKDKGSVITAISTNEKRYRRDLLSLDYDVYSYMARGLYALRANDGRVIATYGDFKDRLLCALFSIAYKLRLYRPGNVFAVKFKCSQSSSSPQGMSIRSLR